MKSYLEYRAGSTARAIIREQGLDPRTVRVFVAAAGGPKWFVSVGFDRAIMKSRFLEQSGKRVLLAGSSAGAWRCLTMACTDPLDAHERLRIVYSRNIFTRNDTAHSIGKALEKNVHNFLDEESVPFVLNYPTFDLAIHVVRGRGPAGSEKKSVQGSAILAAALLNVISTRGMDLFFERVVFHSGPEPPHVVQNSFKGKFYRLSPENLRMVAVATGSLPYIVSGVHNIPNARPGVYRDGGLTDYQLNTNYCPGENGIILFFHYQKRIIPGWFDKRLWWKRPPRGSLDQVLQVYPGTDFVRLLPEGRLPDRNDFTAYVDNPQERIRRWDTVAQLSNILGEQFIEAVESGKIRDRIQPIDT